MMMSKKLKRYCMEVALRSEIYVDGVANDGQEILAPDYEYVFLTMSHEEIVFIEKFWVFKKGAH